MQSSFDEGLGDIIRDEYVLRPEYLPDRIPHREDKLGALVSHFSAFFRTGEYSTILMLSGPVGSGKTMLAKKLCIEGRNMSKHAGSLIKFCMVNARIDRGPQLFVNRIIKHVGLALPKRGYDPVEVLNLVLEDLSKNRYALFTIIDEVETFIELVNPDLLYLLVRSSEFGGPPTSVLLISKGRDFVKHLDASLRSSLSVGMVELKGYTEGQLFDILKDRTELAFFPGTVSDEVLKYIAGLASKFGDARLAIDMLYRAGKLAELEGENRMLLEHVRKAYEEIHPPIDLSALSELSKKERAVLKAVAEISNIRKEITMGELKETIKGISYTALWMTVKMLEAKGLVEVRRARRGRGQTSTVATTLEPKFVLSILGGDT